MTSIEKIIVVLIIALLIAMGVSASRDIDDKKVFMQSCLQDKKQYECDALYAHAHPEPQQYIVWMPMGR
jgi:hypothetical protein